MPTTPQQLKQALQNAYKKKVITLEQYSDLNRKFSTALETNGKKVYETLNNRLNKIIAKNVLVSIKSTTGNTISSINLSIVSGQNVYPIPIKKLSKGVYIVEVIGNGFSKSLKLIAK